MSEMKQGVSFRGDMSGAFGSNSYCFGENAVLSESALNVIDKKLIITDLHKKIIFANDDFVKCFQYSRKELFENSISILSPLSNNGFSFDDLFVSSGGEQKNILQFEKKNGDKIEASIVVKTIHDNEGGNLGYIWEFDCDFAMKKENIAAAEAKYRSLFVDLRETVYESTPDGKLLNINPSGLELFGYDSLDELSNLNIAKTLYANEADRERFKLVLNKKEFVKDYEIAIRRKNGEERIVLETASVVKDDFDNPIAYRGIIRDITESKKNEKLLKKYADELAKANKEKDKFFSIIAHDLKSPFNSMLGLTEILVEDSDELSKEEIKSYATEVHKSAKGMHNLLVNLLQWSQIKTGRLQCKAENVDLYYIVSEAVELLRRNAEMKDIDLINRIRKETFVRIDVNMISSVLQNLISNAIKFTSANGMVLIYSSDKEEKIVVSVKDTGVGMRQEEMDKVFRIDEHHTTPGTANETGTGLGLVLCKQLVEKNHGEICVESEVGQGTTFRFTIPKTE